MDNMRLTRGCKAGMLLLAKFRSGEVTGTEKPKAVHESDAEFQKYSLTKFRSFYNRLKKDLTSSENESHGNDALLNRKCTVPLSAKLLPQKRRLIDDEASEEDEDGVMSLDDVGEVPQTGRYQPLTLVSEWVEPKTMTKRVTVCITLPSGVDRTGFSVRVLEGGMFLELNVAWPRPLSNVDVMHRKWKLLSRDDVDFMSDYHPEILGFEQALKALRERSTDAVHSVSKIPLPFPVETHIVSQFPMAWREDTMRGVYVRLRAVVEEYAVQNNSEDFEVV